GTTESSFSRTYAAVAVRVDWRVLSRGAVAGCTWAAGAGFGRCRLTPLGTARTGATAPGGAEGSGSAAAPIAGRWATVAPAAATGHRSRVDWRIAVAPGRRGTGSGALDL